VRPKLAGYLTGCNIPLIPKLVHDYHGPTCRVQAAIETGKSSTDAVGGLYDSAVSVYGKFDGARQLKDRHRSLELVVNGTSNNLKYDGEYFDSGTWCFRGQ